MRLRFKVPQEFCHEGPGPWILLRSLISSHLSQLRTPGARAVDAGIHDADIDDEVYKENGTRSGRPTLERMQHVLRIPE